ncbi:MAG: uroporphyrinogen-III C-methyltransferase [Dehalococcoidia bacterium]|nr:MAG: uroporphyrinogen-III C-methyltransferase [Dehalococcoidia bacterium]
MNLGHVWLVGAGPGDPGLITVNGLAALRRAEVVIYDRLASRELLDEAPAGAIRIDAGKSTNNHTLTQEEINALLVEHGQAGRRVVRLKGGDPYVFGRGSEEALALAEAGVPCIVIPGVTSAIGGLAVGGVPVTHRAVATSFAVVTGHEDPTKPREGVDWTRLAGSTDTLVVLMGTARLDGIARALTEGGRAATTPAAVVQEASTPRQRAVTGTLATIAEVARAAEIAAPALLVIGDVAAFQQSLAPAALAPLAGKRVLVTRTRAQASTLVEALRLEGAHPLLLPAIELDRRVDAAAAAQVAAALAGGTYTWTAFTSTNAVDVFLDALFESGGDARSLGRTRIAAVGPGTERALRARGLRADLVPAEAIGEALGAALAPHIAGGRVLLPRAEGARDVLPAALRAAGADVEELTLYLAAPPADPPAEVLKAVQAGQVDVAMFTSSSTVTHLAAMLGNDLSALRNAVIACIGPIVAETARERGLQVDVVAEPHTIDGLVEATRAFMHARRPARTEVR